MSRYNPAIHHRRSIRLKGYDYSQEGAYFVTICANNKECLFGNILDGGMLLNQCGEIVEKAWNDLPNHYSCLELDRFIVMPNHFHGIVVLVGAGNVGDDGNVGAGNDDNVVGAGLKPAPTRTTSTPRDKRHGLQEIVRAFKTFSARRINQARNSPGVPVWQRNYYEHIIRSEADYNRIAEYVARNPQQWVDDKLHPDNFVAGKNVGRNANVGGDDDNVVGAGNDGNVGAGFKPAPTKRGTTGRVQ